MPLTIVLLHYHTHTPEPSLTAPHRTPTRRRTRVALTPELPRTTSARTRRRDPYDAAPPPPSARAGAERSTAAGECLVGGTSTRGPAGEPTAAPARPRAPRALPVFAPALSPRRVCLVSEAPQLAVPGQAVSAPDSGGAPD